MWNYSFVVPSALMMVTLFCFYFSRPRLPIRINRTFLYLLGIEVLVLVSDIISTKADENYQNFSAGELYAANMLFFVLFLVRILFFYRFTVELLHMSRSTHPVFLGVTLLPFVGAEVLCLSSCVTGAVFSIQESGYVSGPFYQVVAVTYFVYIAISMGLIVTKRKNMRPHDFTSAFFCNLALFVGTTIRVTLPKLLVMDTFCMVAIAIIYLGILNPDLYLCEYGDAFNMRGLRLVLMEPMRRHDYHLLGIALQNYSQERSILGGRQMDGVVELISEYLQRTFPDMMLFYLRGGRFVVMSGVAADWKSVQGAIQQRFGQPWESRGSTLRLGASFVHVDSSSDLTHADRIINNLVIALDNAKRSAMFNRADTTSEAVTAKQVDQQIDTLRILEHTIQNNKVEVFFQPMFDANTRELVGAEALARIRDDAGRIMSPGLFIPIAESSGLINELGRQVLRRTCEFICSHDLDAMGIRWINVNLSPIQCLQQDLAQQFEDMLAEYGVSVDMIRLEITEQSMLDYSLLRRQILELDNGGFRFVMDDYGSGYSNLVRVKQYPFITIKLDMEIVWDYFKHRDTLLPTIVEGFRGMGLSITAEGIESEEMAQVLAGIGTDYLQGYYFSKPLPPEEFVVKYAA